MLIMMIIKTNIMIRIKMIMLILIIIKINEILIIKMIMLIMITIKVCVLSGDRMDVIIMLIASAATAEHNSAGHFGVAVFRKFLKSK